MPGTLWASQRAIRTPTCASQDRSPAIRTLLHELPPAPGPLSELQCVGLLDARALMQAVHEVAAQAVAIVDPLHGPLIVPNLRDRQQAVRRRLPLCQSPRVAACPCCCTRSPVLSPALELLLLLLTTETVRGQGPLDEPQARVHTRTHGQGGRQKPTVQALGAGGLSQWGTQGRLSRVGDIPDGRTNTQALSRAR